MLSIAHSRLPSRKCSVVSYSMIEVSSSWTSLPFVRQLCVSSCARPLTLLIKFYRTAPASLWPCGIDSGGRQPRPIRNISSQKKSDSYVTSPVSWSFWVPDLVVYRLVGTRYWHGKLRWSDSVMGWPLKSHIRASLRCTVKGLWETNEKYK